MNVLKNYINGAWTESLSKETIAVTNPGKYGNMAKRVVS
jgi:hypothetical protein